MSNFKDRYIANIKWALPILFVIFALFGVGVALAVYVHAIAAIIFGSVAILLAFLAAITSAEGETPDE